MHIHMIAFGKMKSGPMKELFEDYRKRLTDNFHLREFEVKHKKSIDDIKRAEQNLILSALPSNSFFILLDERGKNSSNEEIANLISLNTHQSLTFIIGGAEGVTSLIREKAHHMLSFGRVTWPHMLLRVMLIEQIYRIQQILKNHPYHRP